MRYRKLLSASGRRERKERERRLKSHNYDTQAESREASEIVPGQGAVAICASDFPNKFFIYLLSQQNLSQQSLVI